MKILIVSHSFPPYTIGGTEVYARGLAEGLAAGGNEVFVLHRVNEPLRPEFELRAQTQGNYRVYTINNTFRECAGFRHTYSDPVIDKKVGALLDEIKPDIAHIQHLMYLSAGIVTEIKARRIPVVFTLNDYWLLCPQGQLFRSRKDVCYPPDYRKCPDCVAYQFAIRKNVSLAYFFLKNRLPAPLFRVIKNLYLALTRSQKGKEPVCGAVSERCLFLTSVLSQIDLFTSPSVFMKKIFVEAGVDEKKIRVEDLGISKLTTARKAAGPKTIFAYIGNLMPAKGVHLLIRAFNELKTGEAELRVYGKEYSYKAGIGSYEAELKRLASGRRDIRFMGGFAHRDAARVMEGIDVLVVPSLWMENSPLVIREALCAGVPVIASRTGGLPELVRDGVNGYLFEAGNAAALLNCLRQCIDQPGRLAGFLPGEGVTDIREHCRKMVDLYNTLVISRLP